MIEIHRSALVPYTTQQMFDLVNNVREYPDHFSWCTQATVLEEEENMLVARLDLRFAGLHHHFTTRNRIREPDQITISLVEGPFSSLEGKWSFIPLGDDGSKVELRLEFDYAGRFGGLALKLGFQGLASRMVDDFCREAKRIHG